MGFVSGFLFTGKEHAVVLLTALTMVLFMSLAPVNVSALDGDEFRLGKKIYPLANGSSSQPFDPKVACDDESMDCLALVYEDSVSIGRGLKLIHTADGFQSDVVIEETIPADFSSYVTGFFDRYRLPYGVTYDQVSHLYRLFMTDKVYEWSPSSGLSMTGEIPNDPQSGSGQWIDVWGLHEMNSTHFFAVSHCFYRSGYLPDEARIYAIPFSDPSSKTHLADIGYCSGGYNYNGFSALKGFVGNEGGNYIYKIKYSTTGGQSYHDDLRNFPVSDYGGIYYYLDGDILFYLIGDESSGVAEGIYKTETLDLDYHGQPESYYAFEQSSNESIESVSVHRGWKGYAMHIFHKVSLEDGGIFAYLERPDLNVDDSGMEFSGKGNSGNVSIQVLVQNDGPEVDSVALRFEDVAYGSVVKSATVQTGSMKSGEENVVSFDWDVEAGHEVYVLLDPSNAIKETDETNNNAVKKFRGLSVYVDVQDDKSPENLMKDYVERMLTVSGYEVADKLEDSDTTIILGGPLANEMADKLTEKVVDWGYDYGQKAIILDGKAYGETFDGIVGPIPQEQVDAAWPDAPSAYGRNFVLIYGLGFDGTLSAARLLLGKLGTGQNFLHDMSHDSVEVTSSALGEAIKTYLIQKGDNGYTVETVSDILDGLWTVEGTVANSDGEPLKFMKVAYERSGALLATTFTGADGEFAMALNRTRKPGDTLKASMEFSPTRNEDDILFTFYNDSGWDSYDRIPHSIEMSAGDEYKEGYILFNSTMIYSPRISCRDDLSDCALMAYDDFQSWRGVKFFFSDDIDDHGSWEVKAVIPADFSGFAEGFHENYPLPYGIDFDELSGRYYMFVKDSVYAWNESSGLSLVGTVPDISTGCGSYPKIDMWGLGSFNSTHFLAVSPCFNAYGCLPMSGRVFTVPYGEPSSYRKVADMGNCNSYNYGMSSLKGFVAGTRGTYVYNLKHGQFSHVRLPDFPVSDYDGLHYYDGENLIFQRPDNPSQGVTGGIWAAATEDLVTYSDLMIHHAFDIDGSEAVSASDAFIRHDGKGAVYVYEKKSDSENGIFVDVV